MKNEDDRPGSSESKTSSTRRLVFRTTTAGAMLSFLCVFAYGITQLHSLLADNNSASDSAVIFLPGAGSAGDESVQRSPDLRMAAQSGYRQLMGSAYFHIVLYTFIALGIIWIILFLQSRKMRQQSHELREQVRHLSVELSSTRHALEAQVAEYRTMFTAADRNAREFRDLYETTGTPTVVVNDDMLIVMVNAEFERTTEYVRSDVEGIVHFSQIVYPDDIAGLMQHFALRRTDHTSVEVNKEFRFLTRSGEARVALAHVSPLPGGRQCVISFMDLTEKKRTEQKMLLLAHTLESVNECVSITDLDNKIIFVNDAFVKTYGYETKELIGQHCSILRAQEIDSSTAEILPETLRGGWHGEILNRRKSGEVFPIELSTTIVHDEKDRPLALVGIAVDITARRRESLRLRRLNECMLGFGADPVENIRSIVALCGELLETSCALYNRIDGTMLQSLGQWKTPEGFTIGSMALGQICSELIQKETRTFRVVRDLHETTYVSTDANISRFGYRTFVEMPVMFDGAVIGSICAFWTRDVCPDENDTRLLGIIASAIGVEEQRSRSAVALRESEEQYQSIFENNVLGVYRTRLDGTFVDCNEAFAMLLGCASRRDVLGRKVVDFYSYPEDRDRFLAKLQRTGHIEANEVQLRSVHGEDVWALISTRLLDDGTMLGTVLDIGRRKEAEKQLRDSEMRYRTLFESNPFPMWVFDKETLAFLAVNDAAVQHYGYSRQEFLSMTIKDIRPPEDVPRLLHNLRTTDASFDKAGSWRHIMKDGTEILAEITSHDIVFSGKRAVMILAADITERARIEQQKLKYTEELQQLNASKDMFFSIISHDLRSPLSTLHGYAEMLSEDADAFSADTIKNVAGSMHALTKRVHRLLENLLEWSRLQAGRMEYQPIRIDMHEVAEDAIDLVREHALRKDLRLRIVSDGPAYASADQRMIRSVMMNLLSNAVKFSLRGGEISIDARSIGGELVSSVHDDGVGMSAQALARLFRIDVNHSTPGTADEPGSGLGLILCKELVELNHGRIWAESSPDTGTTFYFTVPEWRPGGRSAGVPRPKKTEDQIQQL